MSGTYSRLTAQRRRSCLHPARSRGFSPYRCVSSLCSGIKAARPGCSERSLAEPRRSVELQLLKPPLCWSTEGNWRKNSHRCTENMQTPWKHCPLPPSRVLLFQLSHPQLSRTPPPAHVFTSCPSHYFSPSSFISPHGPEQRPQCVGWRGQSGRGARIGGGGGERAEGGLSWGATATSWEPVAALGTVFFIGTAWLFVTKKREKKNCKIIWFVLLLLI